MRFNHYICVFIGLLATCFYSCENDIEKINIFLDERKLPQVTIKDTEILYSDSAKLKVKIITSRLEKYNIPKDPYIEFPDGIHVIFYDKNENIESQINAQYAIYWEAKDLWKAENNVKAVNKDGEQLNTELLFWDQRTEKIYSNKFVKIINEDGTFYGENGFESNQDLSKWKLIGSKGSVNIKDEE